MRILSSVAANPVKFFARIYVFRETFVSSRDVIGVPVPNQDINARNHYYVTVRSTGQIQIRKIVNGVITVLATSNFSAVPNRYYEVRFLVINDQLHLYLDHVLVANAHDRDLTSGRYGTATYRAAANSDSFWVLQP